MNNSSSNLFDPSLSFSPSDTLHRLLLEIIPTRDNISNTTGSNNVNNTNTNNTTTIVSEKILNDACNVLQQFIAVDTGSTSNNDNEDNDSDSDCGDVRKILSSYASTAAERLFRFGHSTIENDTQDKSTKKNKKRTWVELQDAAWKLQKFPSASPTSSLESNALAISLIFGALSVMERQRYQLFQDQQQYQYKKDTGSAKAAASALSTTILRNKPLREAGRSVSTLLLKSYINDVFVNEHNHFYFDLTILNYLAKSFQLTEEAVDSSVTAAFIGKAIVLQPQQRTPLLLTNINDDDENQNTVPDETKQIISGALALAYQLRPWSNLSPIELIDPAVAYDFYHAAEEICKSAHKVAVASSSSSSSFRPVKLGNDDDSRYHNKFSLSEQHNNVRWAVERLIDNAMKDRMYRRADAISTSLYDMGGQSRYVKARYYHACDTISKVISKRQFPIVERQVERVERAVAKVHIILENDDYNGDNNDDTKEEVTSCGYKSNDDDTRVIKLPVLSTSALTSPCEKIRKYAIEKMEEAGEITSAQRLASLYGIDYVYDEKAALLAATVRRQKYLQYDDVLPGIVPPLISTPDELRLGFDQLLDGATIFGFDAEWDEETTGAALLQLANAKMCLLIDIPAISSTIIGVKTLRETVGELLNSPSFTLVGFSCRQDVSRLQASPCAPLLDHSQQKGISEHWITGVRAVVDLQMLVGKAEPSLRTTGLSRACAHYLFKPLDKSEQCSLWSRRPLSERQRFYASLDAWVCVGIYNKLVG